METKGDSQKEKKKQQLRYFYSNSFLKGTRNRPDRGTWASPILRERRGNKGK